MSTRRRRPRAVRRHLEATEIGVYGLAEVYKPGGSVEVQHVPLTSPDGQNLSPAGDGTLDLPAKGALIADLVQGQPSQYAPNQVIVVYKPSVTVPGTVFASAGSLAKRTPAYTSAVGLNTVLDRLGVDRAQRMFPSAAQRGRLSVMRSAAQAKLGRPLLDFSDAVVLHVTGSSVGLAARLAGPVERPGQRGPAGRRGPRGRDTAGARAPGRFPGRGPLRGGTAAAGNGAGEQFTTATDPADISLSGSQPQDWITISPDWTGLFAAAVGVTYRLHGASRKTLASTPWARLQPSTMAVCPVVIRKAPSPRSVHSGSTARNTSTGVRSSSGPSFSGWPSPVAWRG
ncbi:MAG: hypothetical protein ACRDN0_15825 [Trebonia sp.]